MAVYPALFERNESGGWVVSFPDFPGCLTEGKNETEAMSFAMDALAGFIQVMRDDGEDLPAPSSISEMDVPDGALVALVPGPPPGAEPAPVRISVSISQKLLASVDRCAKDQGMTRSGFLAAGARMLLRSLEE